MKDYKVDFIGNKGNRNYRSFDSFEEARKFAEKIIDENCVIKKYNSETFEYEIVG